MSAGAGLALLLATALPASAGVIWIEGEAPSRTNLPFAHPWYAQAVRQDQLSGGAMIANYGTVPGLAEYAVTVPAAGIWAFWVRANPTARMFSYRLDGGPWRPIDMERNIRGRINLAADGGVDLRYIAWAKIDDLHLAAGVRRLEFKFHDGKDHLGSLDCFVLSDGLFEPMGKLRPGDKTGLADPGTWSFEPDADPLDDRALLDLRALNEPVAGQSGFVRLSADGNGFVLGDGTPVRFWAANTTVFRHADVAAIERHGRFLAKRGVNMVRAHVQLPLSRDGSALTDVDADTVDDIRRLVAGMKRAGIYTTISPYWGAAQHRVPASWGIDHPIDRDAQGLLFFNGTLQRGYRAWLQALYAPVNPHTGIPLSRDPAVGVIQLQNEDSLLFWTIGNLKGPQQAALDAKFRAFLTRKHGTVPPAAGLQHIWELTQERPGGLLDDQTEFLARTMHEFNADMAKYLRDTLGCRQLINAGNWRTADQARLLDAERWSYTANEVIAVNQYYGPVHANPARPERASYMVEAGDLFTDPSALLEPRELPVNLRHVAGRPSLVTESTWTAPMSHTAEAPFLVAAYGSLSGLAGYYWFSTDAPEYALPDDKFPFADPAIMGGFPATALAYRRGDITAAPAVVHEERTLAQVWSRRPPVLAEEQGFDPNRDAGDRAVMTRTATAHPLAFLAGRVEAVYGGDPAKTRLTDLSGRIDDRAKRIRSVTDELDLDRDAGICTLDAPRVQGAAGFLARRRAIALADVTMTVKNPYAVVMAIALDGAPLKVSRRVLVQVTTVARAHGFRTEPATWKAAQGDGTHRGFRIVDLGGPPWNVVRTDATLTIRNPHLREAIRLDSNGIAAGTLPVRTDRGGLTLTLPPDALYTVLR